MVLKCTHYITRITLNLSQTGCIVASQLGFEPGLLVWRTNSLPTKPSGPALNNLRFAYDVALISQNEKELQEMVNDLARGSKMVGLYMNAGKKGIVVKPKRRTSNSDRKWENSSWGQHSLPGAVDILWLPKQIVCPEVKCLEKLLEPPRCIWKQNSDIVREKYGFESEKIAVKVLWWEVVWFDSLIM